jgi:hypothetical protein
VSGRRIGILGSYGAVGTAVVSDLAEDGLALRLGGRDGGRLAAQAAGRRGAETQVVAVDDAAALARFCADCAVVVNCAGPSYRILDRVACAALAAGADYVDPGGDEPVMRRLDTGALRAIGRRAVLTAGMMPGLSSLLPRWIAGRSPEPPAALTAYLGTLDHLSPSTAADYLLSVGGGTHGDARAAWQDGAHVANALEPQVDVRLPHFPGRVTAFPYLSVEAERLARSLALREVRWFNVFDGQHMLAALGRLQAAGSAADEDLAVMARDLTRAAELDLFGRDPYQLMVFEVTDGAGEVRSFALRAGGTYELTAATAAFTVRAVLEQRIPPGAHYADEVLEPERVPEILAACRSATVLDPLEAETMLEEGVL